MTADRGIFIVFEGIEGSGKSTHVRELADRLASEGRTVLVTREPGGTALGESIRTLLQGVPGEITISPESELMLFAASRAQLVREVITPALERGEIVISDRFTDSAVAYQGYARGLDMDTLSAVNRFVAGTAMPDLVILMDLDVGEGLRRLGVRNENTGRSSDRIEQEDIRFHEQVRAGYLDIARKHGDRVRVIDAALSIDGVSAEVWEKVSDVLRRSHG
ncbi:MAG: dTMP kinase [Lentisphaerales bacterium]|nr:MAG: dTMP kinase [Lentisphaerales bacterium]